MAAERESGSGMASPALGAVLAGGRGSRLGGAKAMVRLQERPLISYPVAALELAGLEAVVVAKPGSELPPLDCAVLREAEQPRHPLCGIVAALRQAGGRPLVVLACDMPFVPPALLAYLAAAGEPLVLAAPGGDPQPLLGRYAPQLLPELELALGREEPLQRTVAGLAPRLLGSEEIAKFGDPGRLLLNVNDEDDLRRAAAILVA